MSSSCGLVYRRAANSRSARVDESSLSQFARCRPAQHARVSSGSVAMCRDAALRSLVSARGSVDPVGARGRESRVCLLCDRARRAGTAPRKYEAPHLRRCAGGAITRRRVASPWWLEPGLRLAARERRLRVHSALRSGVDRAELHSLNSGAIGTDAHESHGGHPRHTCPRHGERGEVAVRRTCDGRASGP